jgi:hypothetical protein
MHVFENVQRRLSVTFAGGLVQHFGHFRLALCAAFLFGILRDGVELHQPPVFGRRHASGVGERVAFQPFAGGEIDALKHCFGSFDLARFIR